MDSIDSAGPKNLYFAEDEGAGHKAHYDELEGGFNVTVKYDYGNSRPAPYQPHKKDAPPLASRDEALKQAMHEREQWYQDHPEIEGYERKKFKANENDPKQLAYLNYSAKPAYNFIAQMTPTTELAHQLGIENFGEEHRKLQFRSTWHHNGLPTYQFHEDGTVKTLHDTVTASNDRTAYSISMMRRVDSGHDGRSVAYTGRPDTLYKALEQFHYIFRSEMAKPESRRQGIKLGKDGVYELTYVVHNLMSAMRALGISATGAGSEFDEAESIRREGEILKELEDLEFSIDGKRVRVKPIYFNQGVSALNDFGTPSAQKEINEKGYKELFELADGNDDPLVQTAVKHLKNVDLLLPEEEYFYRDLLCKHLGLPEVVHCKSSTDRTMLMVAISMATKEWLDLGLKIPEPPHTILQDPRYKELYLSNILSGHQVTRISRSAEGTVAQAKQFSKIIGYEWGTNSFTKNYVALRMLPERFSQKGGDQPSQVSVALKVLKFINWFFGSKGISQRISYLERAYIDREFKPDLFLTKPKGMKMHYPENSKNPQEVEDKRRKEAREARKRGEEVKKKMSFGTQVGRFAMGVYAFFSTLTSIPSLLQANTELTD